MVAIVSGKGVGLERTSAWVLGSQGQLGSATLGRGGDRVFVNGANGNLVITRQDEFLIGRGNDISIDRTYNSQTVNGLTDGDNDDQWRMGVYRKVTGLSGSYGGYQTTVKRIDWDGSDTIYKWDATQNAYIGREAGGRHDRLTRSGTTWTWTDGDSRVTELYDETNGGRITTTSDRDGNSLTYTYNAGGLITRVTNANGPFADEYTELVYNGTQLAQITTQTASTLTRVFYEYDTSGRLWKVKVNLDLGDNSATSGDNYETVYGYDGASKRVTSITQTDGSSLTIGYTLAGTVYKVTSLTQTAESGVTRATTISYASGKTTVTDAEGKVSHLHISWAGDLSMLEQGDTLYSYSYNIYGDVALAAYGLQNAFTYDYGPNGEQVTQMDTAGNTVRRSYSINQELLTETRYAVADPDGWWGPGESQTPMTTRYAYDSYGHLRYSVSAEGHVTEYITELNPANAGYGQRTATINYVGQTYNTSGILWYNSIPTGNLDTWVWQLPDKSAALRTETVYDFRGNVAEIKSYSKLLSDGTFDTSSELSHEFFVYDQAGNLLSRHVAGSSGSEVFAHDGLNRLIASTDFNSVTTNVAFHDATATTVVSHANGLVATSLYNLAGELVTYTESGPNVPSPITSYRYDGLGRLRVTIDPLGQRDYFYYDQVGRTTAEIDSDGSAVEYRYDDNGDLVSTTRYADKLSAAALASLADANGNPTSVTFEQVRPARNDAEDRWTWHFYDNAKRLARTVDATGVSTTYAYDGASRLVSTTRHTTPVAATVLSNLRSPNLWSNPNDATLWETWALSIQQAGTIAGSNAFKLTTLWNGQQGAFSDPVTVTAGEEVTFSLWVKGVAGTTSNEIAIWDDVSASNFGDDFDSIAYASDWNVSLWQLSGGRYRIEGLSTTTPTQITIVRKFNETATTTGRFYVLNGSFDVDDGYSAIVAAPKLVVAPPPVVTDALNDRTSRHFYDKDGRLIGTLDAEGYLAEVVYDKAGQKMKSTAYSGATGAQWRATGTFAELKNSITIDNAKDIHTYCVYDARGLLRAEVDGEGNLTRYAYTPLGDVSEVVTGQKLDPAALLSTPPTFANLPAAPSGTVLQTISYTRNLYGQPLTETTSLTGSTTTTTAYTYDNMGLLVSTTTQSGGADSRIRTQRHDARGRLHAEMSGIGSAILDTLGPNPEPELADPIWGQYANFYAYDQADRLISTSNSGGGRTLFYYDADDRLAYQVHALGEVVEHRYNGLGDREETIVYATRINNETLWEMTGGRASDVASVIGALTDPTADGRVVVGYDVAGRVVAETALLGNATRYEYNSFGEVRLRGVAFGLTTEIETSFVYDRRGQLKSEILDSGVNGKAITTAWDYDAFGRAFKVTDAAEQPTTTVYDRAGRVAAVIDALNNTTWFTYDARGNLVAVKDALNHVTRYVYDHAGRQILAVDALGGVVKTTYDDDGRVLATRAYATAISLSGFGLEVAAASVTNQLVETAHDRVSRYAYDKDGRLRFQIDGAAGLTEHRYDNVGNAIRTIRYGWTVSPASTYTADDLQAEVDAHEALGHPRRVSRSVYDLAGRMTFAIDALGNVTQFTYDSRSRVIKQVALANPFAEGHDPHEMDLQNWAAGNAHADDRISRAVYDPNGRLVYSVDAERYVTQYSHDRMGNVTLQVRYADRYTVGENETQVTMAALLPTIPESAVTTEFFYDSAGRLEGSRDSLGRWTVLTLDPLGHVISMTEAYGTVDATTTERNYDELGRLEWEIRALGAPEQTKTVYGYNALGEVTSITSAAESPDQSVTMRIYDARGRLDTETRAHGTAYAATTEYDYDVLARVVAEIDPNDVVTTRTYDTLGRLLTVSEPVDPYPAHNSVTTNEYDAFGDLVKVTDPRLNSGFFYYDALGRVTLQVDPEGFATQTAYTRWGVPDTVTRYADKVIGTPQVGAPPTLDPDPLRDAVTDFDYDALNRLTKVTDAEAYWESYLLDSFGNRLEVTNKLGGVTHYGYDELNRLAWEILPTASYHPGGALQSATVTNRYLRDARGNLKTKIEAEGLNEERVTGYKYDQLDRLIETSHEAVQVVGPDLATLSTEVPKETYQYDRRGNVVMTTDLGGARTLSYFDALDRKTAEVRATEKLADGTQLGTLSTWSHDANGNILTARVYEHLVTVPTAPGATAPQPILPAEVRETFFTYYPNNRLYSVSQGMVMTGAWNGQNYVMQTRDDPQYWEYDAGGNIIRGWEDNKGYRRFYDKLGRMIGEISERGFIIREYDAEGNVSKETRRAGLITANPQSNWTLADLYAAAAPSDEDRITLFKYDRNGRRVEETRLNVAIGVVSSAGALTPAVADATIYYDYNGLGQIVSKTEANGDVVDLDYDDFGRLRETRSAEFEDHQGLDVRPLTETFHDGLGNLVRTVADGGAAADRETIYVYGADGRLASTTDAAGFQRSYGYDVAGRVVKESYERLKSDLVTVLQEAIGYRYDLAGRLVTQSGASWGGSSWIFGDAIRLGYNAFGELTGRGITGGPDAAPVYQETFDYDRFGRMWRSTEGDGSARLYIHDDMGNATIRIDSVSTTLDLGAYDSIDHMLQTLNGGDIYSIGNQAIAGVTFTISIYFGDKLVQTREPFRELTYNGSGGVNTDKLINQRSYNAFGEVASETDARGNTTLFTYNTMGRLTKKQNPVVTFTNDDGVVVTGQRPTEEYFYDISGRLVAVKDANGNENRRHLLAGTGHGGEEAKVTAEFHPDGHAARTWYDLFGDARLLRNELSASAIPTYNAASDEKRAYDEMGRVTGVIHRGALLTDSYVYDGLGQRTRHSNDFLSGAVERTDYDMQGRVTLQTDMMGGATGYSYSWNGSLTTSGLGTFGAWVKTTFHVSGTRQASETLDYFGRTIARTDLGQHGYSYTFDKGARLISQVVGGGYGTAFTYFNTGKLAQIVDGNPNGINNTSRYGYDKAGNRLTEHYGTYIGTTLASLHQTATVAWDAMGRMTSFDDTGSGGQRAVSADYAYDANGNLMRVEESWTDTSGVAHGPRIRWYRYDPMNRMVVAEGTLSNGEIVRGGAGMDIEYDEAGRRARVTRDAGLTGRAHYFEFYEPGWPGIPDEGVNGNWQEVDAYYIGERREDYSYRADGSLMQVRIAETGYEDNWDGTVTPTTLPETGVLRVNNVRDAMGRSTSYAEYMSDGATVIFSRNVNYDNRSSVLSDSVSSLRYEGSAAVTYVTNTTNVYTLAGAYQGGIVVSSSTTGSRIASNGTTSLPPTLTNNTYSWWDDARLHIADLDTDTNNSGAHQISTYSYDIAGRIIQVRIVDGTPRTAQMVTDHSGQVISRLLINDNGQPGPKEYYHYFNGIQVGEVGNNGSFNVDYNTSMIRRTWGPGSNGFRWNSIGTPHADLDLSFEHLNGDSQAMGSGGRYTVNDGDTLQSIAAMVWGDASLWYLIAQANGLTGADALVGGQSLVLPARVTNVHNDSGTFRVYDPNKTWGDNNPTTPKPAKKAKGGCGVIGTILVIALAVAITLIIKVPVTNLIAFGSTTAPALSGAAAAASLAAGGTGLATAGTLASIAGAAVTGALASAASQGFGVLTGLQSKFDWKGVALAGITAGISQGVGGGTLIRGAGTVVNDVARGALVNAATQGVAIATGLQKKFDWAGIAAAAAVSGVGGAVDRTLGAWSQRAGTAVPSWAGELVNGLVGGGAGAAVRSALTGTSFGDNLIAVLPDVIGRTIGNIAADAVQGGLRRGTEPATTEESAEEIDLTLSDGSSLLTGDLPDFPQLPGLPSFAELMGFAPEVEAVRALIRPDAYAASGADAGSLGLIGGDGNIPTDGGMISFRAGGGGTYANVLLNAVAGGYADQLIDRHDNPRYGVSTGGDASAYQISQELTPIGVGLLFNLIRDHVVFRPGTEARGRVFLEQLLPYAQFRVEAPIGGSANVESYGQGFLNELRETLAPAGNVIADFGRQWYMMQVATFNPGRMRDPAFRAELGRLSQVNGSRTLNGLRAGFGVLSDLALTINGQGFGPPGTINHGAAQRTGGRLLGLVKAPFRAFGGVLYGLAELHDSTLLYPNQGRAGRATARILIHGTELALMRAGGRGVQVRMGSADDIGRVRVGTAGSAGTNPYNISTAGMTAAERQATIQYAQRTNAWLAENGPTTVRSTAGPLRSQADSAARTERLRAARNGTPYQGQAGHVPDTALTGNARPPAGWLDMPGRSNSVVGGGLSSRIGRRVDVVTVDGRVP